jgi:uncharacterized protein (TIGR02391 family)
MMARAIPKLERRLVELQALQPEAVTTRSDRSFQAVELKIDETLVEIFGHDSVEYDRYRVSLDTAPVLWEEPTPLDEVREGYQHGIEDASTKLRAIVDIFRERLLDADQTAEERAGKVFGDLKLHPEIARATGDLFRDGHYANAIEDACKVLNGLVKIRSGRDDLDGTDLMTTVFSSKNPVLAFSAGQSETDESEQKGMMFLYAGAMLALRNPRAHEIIRDDPEAAVKVIAFLSFLADLLDKAERKKS